MSVGTIPVQTIHRSEPGSAALRGPDIHSDPIKDELESSSQKNARTEDEPTPQITAKTSGSGPKFYP